MRYKARRKGKLVIAVPAFYTSQECGQCGHIHEDNRKTQADFICLRCGYTENADINAAKVIAGRGVKLLLSDSYAQKKVKKCWLKKNKIAPEGRESVAWLCQAPTPEETTVRRKSGNAITHGSMILETPATTPVFGV